MKTFEISISSLNENDDPTGGKCLGDDGRDQLWQFGEDFANRHEDEGGVYWSSDRDDLEGWFHDNDLEEWINRRLG